MSNLISFSPTDIRVAGVFRMTSFSPEVRERQYRDSFVARVNAVDAEFQQWQTDDNREEMIAALGEWYVGFRTRTNGAMAARSRIASQMITGSGGWTPAMVRRNNKRNETADTRSSELAEWSRKTLERLRRRFDPQRLENEPVRVGEVDATEKLQAKIDAAEKLQAHMVAVNKAIRKAIGDRDAQVTALGKLGIGDAAIAEILTPDCYGGIGYPHFRLTNNSANIRRMKAQVVKSERLNALESTEETINGIRIVDSQDANRVQMFFPGKPDAAIRDELKIAAFRWTPSIGAWQAYRSIHAFNVAKEIARKVTLNHS